MRDYGKVHTSFWTSSSIRAMSEDGRTLAMYLLTCPHGTIAGIFRLPDGYASDDLQWGSERVKKGFDELFQNGFATRCETTKWVWITKHFEWNPPENPNQKTAAAKVAAQVPDDCVWKPDFMRDCGVFFHVIKPQKTNPSPTLSKPFLNQEQEQEQEQEKRESTVQKKSSLGKADSNASPTASPKPKVSPTGTRLPEGWALPRAWGEWAIIERNDLTADDVRREAACFADYWHGKAGADARKVDWEATWRNWIRRSNGVQAIGARPARLARKAPSLDNFDILDYGGCKPKSTKFSDFQKYPSQDGLQINQGTLVSECVVPKEMQVLPCCR